MLLLVLSNTFFAYLVSNEHEHKRSRYEDVEHHCIGKDHLKGSINTYYELLAIPIYQKLDGARPISLVKGSERKTSVRLRSYGHSELYSVLILEFLTRRVDCDRSPSSRPTFRFACTATLLDCFLRKQKQARTRTDSAKMS